jgi:hypothetical protein
MVASGFGSSQRVVESAAAVSGRLTTVPPADGMVANGYGSSRGGGGSGRYHSLQLREPDDPEVLLFGALAGADSPVRRLPGAFEWNGAAYEVDLPEILLSRMAKVRERQGGNSLGDVLALWEITSRLMAPGVTMETVRREAAALGGLVPRLGDPVERKRKLGGRRLPDVKRSLAEAQSRLQRIRQPGDLRRIGDVTVRLSAVVDILFAHTMRSCLYAAHIRNPGSSVLLGRDPANRHDPGWTSYGDRFTVMWGAPREQVGVPGEPWHVRGGLLGLELALWRSSRPFDGVEGARPIAGGNSVPGQQASGSVLASADLAALRMAPMLFDAFTASDEETREIAGRLREGRRKVSGLASSGAASDFDEIVAPANLTGWRVQALTWVLAHDKESAESLFSLSELLAIGGDGASSVLSDGSAPSPGALDRWGTPMVNLDGSLRLRLERPEPWENYAGRLGAGFLAARSSDIIVRLAELLAEMKVPAALALDLMPVAVQEVIAGARLLDGDDYLSLQSHAMALSAERLSEQVSAIADSGAR